LIMASAMLPPPMNPSFLFFSKTITSLNTAFPGTKKPLSF